MKQILLAINGDMPTRPVVQYAADLCSMVKAELCILQLTSSDPLRSQVPGALKQMLKSPGCPVSFKVARRAGSIEKDLSEYIDIHHNIILTVYDPSRDRQTPKADPHPAIRINHLKAKLKVPLVVVSPVKQPARKTDLPHHRP